jgi:hypothetical protein
MQARSERPISRLISWVRPPIRPLTDSRSLRVLVADGSIAYSAVTQPRPEPLRQRGTPSVTLAAHSTRVLPNSTSTEPAGGNIEGIISFFGDRSMGAPDTWVSYVDAGILEGIERGIAIASGRGTDTFGNPGSTLWASYLTKLATGQLRARSAHDLAWSQAEQASTDHGVVLAEQIHGIPASGVEQRFFEFSEFYRFTLRSRSALLDPFSPGPGPGPQRQLTFLDWFTDVANPTPSHRGAELAYSLAEFDLPAGALRSAALLAAYGRALLTDYVTETR